MELGKYKKAMRPKKYLTRDFIVYQDPSYTSVVQGYGSLDTPPEGVEMRIDKQAGGVVQREGFANSKAPYGKRFTEDMKKKVVEFAKQGKSPEFIMTQPEFEGVNNARTKIIAVINQSPKVPKKYKYIADARGQGFTFGQFDKIKKDVVKDFNKQEIKNIAEIGRDRFPQMRAEAANREVRRILQEAGVREIPETLKGKPKSGPKTQQLEGDVRKVKLKTVSDESLERSLSGTLKDKIEFHHADSKNLNARILTTANRTGYISKADNEAIRPGDALIDKYYEDRAKLLKKKPKGGKALKQWQKDWEVINKKGMNTVANPKYKGLLNFKVIDPVTFEVRDTGLDESKMLMRTPDPDIPGLYDQDDTLATKPFKQMSIQEKKQVRKIADEKYKNVKKKIIQGINESSPQDLTDFISTLAPGCKLKYADGGRVSYSTGSDCYNRGLEMLKQASQGDKTTAQKVGQSLKQFGKATGKLARFIELPLEIALEGLLIGWDTTFNAKPLDESIKDNSIVLRAIFSDFQTSGEQDRAANIAKQNPQAAKYVEAKEALDKYNKLKNTIDTFKEDLASADNYQNAVVRFEEYENKIEDKIPQYKAILTPGSPEYEAFKEARIGLARDRVEKTYGRAQEMEELLQPFAGTTDVADMQKAKAEEIQGRIEDISSIYNFGPTFEEFKKETLPRLYELSNKKQTPETDAMLEPLLRSQYNKNLKLFSRPQFSKGGLTRRGFLKVVGALTALAAAAKTGIMKITTPAAKKVLKDAPQGTPDWFAPLVEKITKEGIDISDKAATIERETVKILKNPKLDEAGNPMYVESLQKDGTIEKIFAKEDVYFLRENSDTGEITISVNSADIGAHGDFVDFNMKPQRIEGISDDGNPIIEGGEFTIAESRATGRVTGPDDVDIEIDEYITNDLDDAASDWHSVEEFATGKTNKKAQIEKQKRKEQIENDPVGDIEDRGGTMDNYAEYFDEDAMKYGFND